ncbi:MAG TPA: hypothetical protein VL693_06465 [Vicinamibacterales bacterium]|jgi:hypothetical protein|nr:hypothetical protein [Vicinamibacterales bacterium]
MEYLTALHDSAFSTWIREAETVWAFPTVLTVHTFGMMLLVGCAWVMDLRLLGVGRTIPIGPLRPLFRIMWFAFWINLATGVLLFIADPERKATSMLFWSKMLLILINLPLIKRLERAVFGNTSAPTVVSGGARQLAAVSAALWAGTIFAGRLLGYM